MQAAPKAGNSGINQMWSRKNIFELSAVSYQLSAASYQLNLVILSEAKDLLFCRPYGTSLFIRHLPSAEALG